MSTWQNYKECPLQRRLVDPRYFTIFCSHFWHQSFSPRRWILEGHLATNHFYNNRNFAVVDSINSARRTLWSMQVTRPSDYRIFLLRLLHYWKAGELSITKVTYPWNQISKSFSQSSYLSVFPFCEVVHTTTRVLISHTSWVMVLIPWIGTLAIFSQPLLPV